MSEAAPNTRTASPEMQRLLQTARSALLGKRFDKAEMALDSLQNVFDRAALASPPSTAEPFQARVKPWLDACFGPQIAIDKIERNHRFLEEALELVQSTGCTQSEAHQLVDYVFGRDVGDPRQEVGGVMNTLAALCLAHGMDMHEAGEVELARVWTKVEQIRAKQAAKPKHSPLPGPSSTADAPSPAQDAAPVDRGARLGGVVFVPEPAERSETTSEQEGGSHE